MSSVVSLVWSSQSNPNSTAIPTTANRVKTTIVFNTVLSMRMN